MDMTNEDKLKLLAQTAVDNGFRYNDFLLEQCIRFGFQIEGLKLRSIPFQLYSSLNDLVSLDFLEALCKAMPYVDYTWHFVGRRDYFDDYKYILSPAESIIVRWSLLREDKLEVLFKIFVNLIIYPKEFEQNFNLYLSKYYTIVDEKPISKTPENSFPLEELKKVFRRNYFTTTL